ncbi:NADP-dependent oxidoreductase [Phaeobacter sp. CAU 1743]|uniref:NADP-dependent oxidoreductase n=1 Tax=Phaeobacter sp. CAU 1743 TaxID=3140367 RepID=UPI0023B476AA
MKAITFDSFGGPEVLNVSDLPDPKAGPGEVLVRVAASTVNPTDLMMRNGAQAKMMEQLAPPYVAGMEFSGVIEDAGDSGLAVGQPVIGVLNPRTPRGGSYAELIAVPAASVAAVSASVDLVGAATVPMNALTAILSLNFLDLKPGDTLLVTGGAGMLGGSVIQLAKAAGVKVLANVGDKDRALVRGLGADVILPRDNFDDALRAECPDGVDGMIDGALIGNDVSHLVRDGGGAVSLRGTYKIEDPRLRVFNVSVLTGMEDNDAIQHIADMLGSGALVPRVAPNGRYAYSDVVKAHQATEAGGTRGRVVLVF